MMRKWLGRLRRAGAQWILGKNNLHEFVLRWKLAGEFFSVTFNNPRDGAHIAEIVRRIGGAAGCCRLCYAAIGTDTAGSIREPAALCGCVGLKPTYGRVSARGVITAFDGRSIMLVRWPRVWGDAAVVLQAVAGYDPLDVCSADVPVGDYSSRSAGGDEESSNRYFRPVFL